MKKSYDNLVLKYLSFILEKIDQSQHKGHKEGYFTAPLLKNGIKRVINGTLWICG